MPNILLASILDTEGSAHPKKLCIAATQMTSLVILDFGGIKVCCFLFRLCEGIYCWS